MNNGKICVSVCSETAEEMIKNIKRAEEFADVIEVRFDCMEPDEVETLFSQIRDARIEKPLLATFRALEQGGTRTISHDKRAAFWKEPRDEFWAGDVEEDVLGAAENWSTRIASFHDFAGIPADLDSICTRLLSSAADIVKVASRAEDIADAIPLWKLLERAKAHGKGIIPIAMGEAGKWTRILGLAHGAFLTYASLNAGDETAPGQITVKDMVEVYRVKELDQDTKVFGIIGDPVSQSLSTYMHNPAFAAAQVNAVFIPLFVKNIDEFMRRMVRKETREVELNFVGFSVTMPHKQAIMKHLDVIDPTAEKIGAVNTVKIDDGKLSGYNTDAHGFIMPLKEKFGDLNGARVAVFGAGGAARACVYALKQENAEVTVFARDRRKGEAFSDEFEVEIGEIDTAELKGLDVVVNATPLGMKGPFENDSLFTADQLGGVKFVYDLVTRPVDTPIVREAKKVAVSAIGGFEMLISQGAKQFEIWTGREAPVELMRTSLLTRMSK